MKTKLLITALFCLSGTVMADDILSSAPNGIMLPENYSDWQIISSSHREDNKTMRIILGNDVAITAVRLGKTNPWPDGTILGKLVWKDATLDKWKKATVPGKFVHAEFMKKNAKLYKDTGGWGFTRWLGMEQKPYGDSPAFVKECFDCHQPAKDNDYVFTHPVELP